MNICICIFMDFYLNDFLKKELVLSFVKCLFNIFRDITTLISTTNVTSYNINIPILNCLAFQEGFFY